MVPSPAAIAESEMARLAQVLRDLGGDGLPVDTGWAACDVPGSWARFATGLGRGGPVSPEELDRLERFFAERGEPTRIRLTPYGHPSLLGLLGARGYTVDYLDTILVHDLADLPDREPTLVIRPVTGAADRDAWIRAQLRGFFGDEHPPGIVPITTRITTYARAHLSVLVEDGDVVGSGGLELWEGAGILFAGCVRAEARRRGHHQSFLRHRLHQARQLGCTHALIGSAAGGPTERNALRLGFRPLYTQLQLISGSPPRRPPSSPAR